MSKLDDLIKQKAYELDCLILFRNIMQCGDCNDCRNGQCEWKPKAGQTVRYNCPHYVGVSK